MKSMESSTGTGGRSSRTLLRLARAGDSQALSALFTRHKSSLRRWARGRLPHWARTVMDTNDLVQEALFNTLRRINTFDDHGRGALQAYLREAVRNRIRDELRRVGRRQVEAALDESMPDGAPTPFELTANSELMTRYKLKLASLSEADQELIVGRIEMGYTYEQLALATGRATSDAARIAARRAVIKLARKMAE